MNSPVVTGVSAEEQLPDAKEVLQRAVQRFNALRDLLNRKRNQSIRFDSFPFGIAFIADNHIGNDGVDYERMFAEAKVIASTPNLYVVQVGDLVDNFIVSKLLKVRLETHITIPEEWALAKLYLELLGPRLLAVCGGNHDAWTSAMAGVDQLKETLAKVNPKRLYDSDELKFDVECEGRNYPVRVRHKWRYSSILNPTHGIERTFERDQSRPFLLGVGAHTHVSGLVRQFNAGGQTGLAVQCGSYKVHDSYAHQLGAPAPNGSTAIVVVFTEHGILGYVNLNMAIEGLNATNT
jgi:hypothetical protein